MALLFMDGFDHNDTTTITSYGKWDENNGGSMTTGRFGSGQCYLAGDSSNNIVKYVSGNPSSGIWQFAFRQTTVLASGAVPVISLMDAQNSVQVALVYNSDRTFSFVRGNTHAGRTTLGTSSYQYNLGDWMYIEVKMKVGSSISANECQLRVNGVTVLSASAGWNTQTTSNAYFNRFVLGIGTYWLTNTGSNRFYDDLVYMDSSGSANNDYIGEQRITTILPNGTGATNAWTNQSGNSTNNHLQVDDSIPPNTDTDYVEDSTIGDYDLYNFADLASNISSVVAVAINVAAKKTDAGARGMRPVVRIGSTNYDQTEISLTASYRNYQQILAARPSDSAAWTGSDVNSAQFGVKVSS